MKLDELLTIISKKLGKPITQSVLADGLGITRQTVSNRIKNDSEVTVSEIIKIENFFNITLFTSNINSSLKSLCMDYYRDFFEDYSNNRKENVVVSSDLVSGFSANKKYFLTNAFGNSMSPTIMFNDKLIVELCNNLQITDSSIYLFAYKNEYFIRRLSKNVDEIIMQADNSDYDKKIINLDNLKDMKIIGKIVNIMRQL